MKVIPYVIQSFATMVIGSQIFERVKACVVRADEHDVPGKVKREVVVDELKTIGLEIANWMLNLAVELAVAYLRSKAK